MEFIYLRREDLVFFKELIVDYGWEEGRGGTRGRRRQADSKRVTHCNNCGFFLSSLLKYSGIGIGVFAPCFFCFVVGFFLGPLSFVFFLFGWLARGFEFSCLVSWMGGSRHRFSGLGGVKLLVCLLACFVCLGGCLACIESSALACLWCCFASESIA